MADRELHWNLRKAVSVGLAVVATTALITGLVVAYWPDGGSQNGAKTATVNPRNGRTVSGGSGGPAPMPPSRSMASPAAPPPPVASAPVISGPVASTPAPSGRVESRDKTTDLLEKALIGGALGAGVGAAGGAIAGGGKGAGKGAAIGGIVGATAGTLYGLQKNHEPSR